MKFTKLKVLWRFEFAKCKLFLTLDFERHCCFFYFLGSGEPSEQEMYALELLVHTYDKYVGCFPKSDLKKDVAYFVNTEGFDSQTMNDVEKFFVKP